jgi:hypothetical protein
MQWRFGLWLLIGGLLLSSLVPVQAKQELVLTIMPSLLSMCGGTGATNTIAVHVTTLDGQPVGNQAVVFTMLSGSGTLSPSSSQTSGEGWASTQYRAPDDGGGGTIVIAATITDATGHAQRVATTFLVHMTSLVAASSTTLSVPGPVTAGDPLTLQLALKKQGIGTPAISLLRLNGDPNVAACSIGPPLPWRALGGSDALAVSAYTVAHLDSTTGVEAVDLSFAYTDVGQPVGLHWWQPAEQRWQLLDGITVDPISRTVNLHISATTAFALVQLTQSEPFFVVVALNRQWLPRIAQSAVQR